MKFPRFSLIYKVENRNLDTVKEMSVRQQDMERMLEHTKKTADWTSKLVSANNLFHQGPSQYSAAVNQFGKIIEILLRHLFQEISIILPPKDRTDFLRFEGQVGKGRPFGNFGLGQMIDFFSKAGIFVLLNGFLKESVLVSADLNTINDFRVGQTHFDEKIERGKVDKIREDTTNILLKLGLTEKDPETIEVAKAKVQEDKKIQNEMLEGLKRILTKIRCGLLENATVEFWSPLDRGDGWSSVVEAKAEIAGIYIDKNKLFTVIVRVLEVQTPLDEEEQAHQDLSSKVREIIVRIAPEVKEKLKILFFAEYEGQIIEGSGLEGSAEVCSNEKGSLTFK